MESESELFGTSSPAPGGSARSAEATPAGTQACPSLAAAGPNDEVAAAALLTMHASASTASPHPPSSEVSREARHATWMAHEMKGRPLGYAMVSRHTIRQGVRLALRRPVDIGAALLGLDWTRSVAALPDSLPSKSREAVILDGSMAWGSLYIIVRRGRLHREAWLTHLSPLFHQRQVTTCDVLAFWAVGPGACGLAVLHRRTQEAKSILEGLAQRGRAAEMLEPEVRDAVGRKRPAPRQSEAQGQAAKNSAREEAWPNVDEVGPGRMPPPESALAHAIALLHSQHLLLHKKHAASRMLCAMISARAAAGRGAAAGPAGGVEPPAVVPQEPPWPMLQPQPQQQQQQPQQQQP
ncbi:hypothetical protein APUTEX25_000265 [Auxenochlorella protothecoides]|uniref:Uncharacterized protein n=1 Tax=Auxenochlorella protothecoides TaxID=3075 RepID=A0A3M7L2C3_AUXPR|nr:hypothetical protein APUTEX25_000265 [Auxenochlorella protothecoides]|eukprot:RMZ55682.1 hypothetical protein APUTEX25_000265 [Auxenochlorella protothecoides]